MLNSPEAKGFFLIGGKPLVGARCLPIGFQLLQLKVQLTKTKNIQKCTPKVLFYNGGRFRNRRKGLVLFLVIASLCQDWIICPPAFLICGSHFSGSISRIKPEFSDTRHCHRRPTRCCCIIGKAARFAMLYWITTWPGRTWVGSASNKRNLSAKPNLDACISSRAAADIHEASSDDSKIYPQIQGWDPRVVI